MKKLEKILLLLAFIMMASNANAISCVGKVVEVEQWSDAQDGKINFKLDSGIRISTTKKNQSAMIIAALMADKTVHAYWSCSPPSGCNDQATNIQICGYIKVLK